MDSGFVVLALIFVVGTAAIGWYMNHRRHERSAEQAAARGWAYHKNLSYLASDVVADVGGGRSSRKFVGVFEGSMGDTQFYAGTAQWTESRGSGKNRRTQTFHRRILLRRIPLNAPHMRLEKEGFFRNIFNRDIKTEWEEFNKAWIVNGDDPRFVSAVLTPTMQQWLMKHQEVNFVLRRGWVSVYSREDRRLDYDDIDYLFRVSKAFTDEIIPFIWQDYRPR